MVPTSKSSPLHTLINPGDPSVDGIGIPALAPSYDVPEVAIDDINGISTLAPPSATHKHATVPTSKFSPLHMLINPGDPSIDGIGTPAPAPSYDVPELVIDDVNGISTPAPPSATHEHVTVSASKSSSPHILAPPDKLHPSLSCWIKNMNKLSTLIDRLHGLASAAPAEHQSQLLRQVVALRAMFKRQQERFIEFLQLSEEFANKYLLDISAEVQQRRAILNNLEERLEAATKLHEEAADLQMFYESRTVATMKDLRASGKQFSVCRENNTQIFYFQ